MSQIHRLKWPSDLWVDSPSCFDLNVFAVTQRARGDRPLFSNSEK